MVENQTARKIKALRFDNGGVFSLDTFLKICQSEGIIRHFNIQQTPQQIGAAKHLNRILVEKVRSMLSNAGLGKEFWADAVNYACHLVNRLPSLTLNGKCPLEVWSDKPISDYDSLHVFGCLAYYYVRDSKLKTRPKKGVFLGFSMGVQGYRIWRPKTQKVKVSRDIKFEDSLLKQCQKKNLQNMGKKMTIP